MRPWYTRTVLLLVTSHLNDEDLQKVAEDLTGYIKVVVDIERRVLSAGGTRHAEGEELLLAHGSTREYLWGGGLDLETGGVDFDSIINIRPRHDNPSREVLSRETRRIMEEIIRLLLR